MAKKKTKMTEENEKELKYKGLDYAESEILLKETITHVLSLLRFEKEEEIQEIHDKLNLHGLDTSKLEYVYVLLTNYYREKPSKFYKAKAKFEHLPIQFLNRFIMLVNDLILFLNEKFIKEPLYLFYYRDHVRDMMEYIKILDKRFKLLKN